MLLYLFVAIWPLAVGWCYQHRRLAIGKRTISLGKHIIISIIPIFVLLAFRSGEMGADTGTYVKHFERMITQTLEAEFAISRMEHGYLIFVKAITLLTHNGLIYQLICVSVMMIGLFIFLKDQKENAFYTVFFYCTLGIFFFMFTGVRQCIAMSICLISYHFVKDKRYIKFLICILVAFFFHKSSILFLIVPLVMNIRINVIITVVYGLASVVAGRYLDKIQLWINDQLEYDYGIEATGSGTIFLIVLLLLTIYSIIAIYNSEKGLNNDPFTRHLININYITLFFWIMRLQTRVAERPSYYFLFFSCALFANAFNRKSEKGGNRIFRFLIIVFCIILYIYRLTTNFSTLIPYQFY